MFIEMENRTPDNLLQGEPGVTTQSWGLNSSGQTVPLIQQSLATAGDPGHGHTSAYVPACDMQVSIGCKMDGFDRESEEGCSWKTNSNCSTPYSYVPASETVIYRQLIEGFAYGDDVDQANQGPSFVAHQNAIGGQSGQFTASNHWGWAENPGGTSQGGITGCNNLAQSVPSMATDFTQPWGSPEVGPLTSCGDFQTIFDEADAAGIPWAYYTWKVNNLWCGPCSQAHLWNNPVDRARVIQPPSQALSDASPTSCLAPITFVTPTLDNSDHPHGDHDALGGPNWVGNIVNALESSPCWQSTVIVIDWDDWGGFYDHVPPHTSINHFGIPNTQDPGGYGMRVPLIVVSPYAKVDYKDETPRSQLSILRLIETTFGLQCMALECDEPSDLTDFLNLGSGPLLRPKAIRFNTTLHKVVTSTVHLAPAVAGDD